MLLELFLSFSIIIQLYLYLHFDLKFIFGSSGMQFIIINQLSDLTILTFKTYNLVFHLFFILIRYSIDVFLITFKL